MDAPFRMIIGRKKELIQVEPLQMYFRDVPGKDTLPWMWEVCSNIGYLPHMFGINPMDFTRYTGGGVCEDDFLSVNCKIQSFGEDSCEKENWKLGLVRAIFKRC